VGLQELQALRAPAAVQALDAAAVAAVELLLATLQELKLARLAAELAVMVPAEMGHLEQRSPHSEAVVMHLLRVEHSGQHLALVDEMQGWLMRPATWPSPELVLSGPAGHV